MRTSPSTDIPLGRRRSRGIANSIAALAFLTLPLIAACSATVSIGGGDSSAPSTAEKITAIDQVTSGECVKLGESSDDGKVTVAHTDCGSTELNFVVIRTQPSSQACTDPNLSELNFGAEKLCLQPQFVEGSCYAIPTGQNASLADYAQIDCSRAAGPNTVGVRIASRTDGPANCAPDQSPVDFAGASPVGYCLVKLPTG